MARSLRLHHTLALLALLVIVVSVLVSLGIETSPIRAQSAAAQQPLLSDDFTHDTALNSTLWQINGSVGAVFGLDEVGFQIILLQPSFSPKGMEIAQINASEEDGTIQSVESFTPPFTATAEVEGVLSNGHTFGFAIASTNASSGVVVYGNLNSTNCSNLINCGDPTTCGTPANSNIQSGQCYYGIDAKVGQGGGHWTHTAKLYLTPSVNVVYTLQISVDASGGAQYSVSQNGQVLGQSTTQVGTGPFFIILEQGEGAPVAKPGPNQAFWLEVSVTPTVTSLSTTPSTPTTSPSGVPMIDLIIIVVVVIILLLLLIILLWSRRRNLAVTVQDSRTLKPIPEAVVSADGPEQLSGHTANDGKITFKRVKKGDYSIGAKAKGYNPSIPVKVSVKKTTEFIVKLEPSASVVQTSPGGGLPPEGPKTITPDQDTSSVPYTSAEGPSPLTQQRRAENSQPLQRVPSPVPTTQPEPAPSVSDQEGPQLEGLGGGRIGQIIKTFQMKGAVSPETALTAEELGLSRLFVRIMKRRQGRTRVFVEINGRFYLNQDALREAK